MLDQCYLLTWHKCIMGMEGVITRGCWVKGVRELSVLSLQSFCTSPWMSRYFCFLKLLLVCAWLTKRSEVAQSSDVERGGVDMDE